MTSTADYSAQVATATLKPPSTEAALAAMPQATRREIVQRLNREYAVVLIGGSVAILRETVDSRGRPEIRLLGIEAFREWMRPVKYWSDQGKPIPVATVWLGDEERRQYDGIVFAPGEEAPTGYYNLWQGYAVQPSRAGSCQRFIDHVAENVCAGDEQRFAWVMGWFAAMVQRPAEKLGTALVLRGPQGAGKTIVGGIIGSLLGPHYQLVSDPRFITGRFNAHLANCLLLQLDEGVWGGDHTAAGKLKDLVTGSDQLIEYKGKEPVRVRNYTRLLITSNAEWVVPAGLEERRFCVLDVGEGRMQDTAYFRALREEMDHGGRERLLQYLLDFDTADVPLYQPLETVALREQQVASLSPELAWWVDVLMRGQLPGDREGTGVAPCADVYSHYLEHAHRRGVTRRSGETALGIFLRRHVPDLRRARKSVLPPNAHFGSPAVRTWCYEFPPLAACRRAISATLRGDAPWEGDAEATWESPP